MKKFDYYQPRSLEEAFSIMEGLHGEARYVAGGTDVIVGIKQRALAPGALVSLRAVEELKGISFNGGLAMGSMTLFRVLERDARVGRDYPALGEAASLVANPQTNTYVLVRDIVVDWIKDNSPFTPPDPTVEQRITAYGTPPS